MSDIITAQFRDIGTITAEIKVLQSQTQRLVLEYSIEIGRRLTEAKELLPHGEWGKWLKDEVDFSQRTANNLMQIFEEYGDKQGCLFGAQANSQTLANLSYSKALRLLAIPEEEREEFAKAVDAEHISTRELEKVIKEKQGVEAELEKAKDEINRLERAQTDIDAVVEKENKLRAELNAAVKAKEKAEADCKAAADKAKADKEKHKKELQKLRDNPEIPPETLAKLRAEAESKAAGELEKSRAALEKAERELKEAGEREAALRKQTQLSSPEAAVFKTLFTTVQEDYNKLTGCLLKIRTSDPALADKLTAAVKAVLNSFSEALK